MSGRGSSAPRAGRATTACANDGRDAAAEAPSAATSTGTAPPGRRPAGRPPRMSSRPARELRAAARRVRGRKSETIPGRSARAVAGDQRRAATGRAAVRRRRRHWTRRPRRTHRDGPARRDPRGPAGGPGRANVRPHPRRTRRRTRRARTAPRTAGRRCGEDGHSVACSWLLREGMDGPPSMRSRRRPLGDRDVGRGPSVTPDRRPRRGPRGRVRLFLGSA